METVGLGLCSLRVAGERLQELVYWKLRQTEYLPPSQVTLSLPRGQLLQLTERLVSALDQPDRLAEVAREIASSLCGRTLLPAHYAAAGSAFLWALNKVLGSRFTAELKEAWGVTYWMVAGEVRRALAETAEELEAAAAAA
jgi:hypothetical protein